MKVRCGLVVDSRGGDSRYFRKFFVLEYSSASFAVIIVSIVFEALGIFARKKYSRVRPVILKSHSKSHVALY